jgi:hypothetical protein
MAVGRISYQTAFAFNQEWITVEFGLGYESERFQDLNRHVNTLSHNPLPVRGPLRERLSHLEEVRDWHQTDLQRCPQFGRYRG